MDSDASLHSKSDSKDDRSTKVWMKPNANSSRRSLPPDWCPQPYDIHEGTHRHEDDGEWEEVEEEKLSPGSELARIEQRQQMEEENQCDSVATSHHANSLLGDHRSSAEYVQVTTKQLHFSTIGSEKGERSSKDVTNSVLRLLILHSPRTLGSVCFVMLVDLLSLIVRSFYSRPFTYAELKNREYVKGIAHHIARLDDFDICCKIMEGTKAHSDINPKSELLNVTGVLGLLKQPAIVQWIATREKQLGEEFGIFINFTLVNTMRIINQGPQPDFEKPASVERVKRRSNKSARSHDSFNPLAILNDPLASSLGAAIGSGSDEGEESTVHCIIARLGDKYLVHWLPEDGLPCKSQEDEDVTEERCEKMIAQVPEIVQEFHSGVRCSIFQKWRWKNQQEKLKSNVNTEKRVDHVSEQAEKMKVLIAPTPKATVAATTDETAAVSPLIPALSPTASTSMKSSTSSSILPVPSTPSLHSVLLSRQLPVARHSGEIECLKCGIKFTRLQAYLIHQRGMHPKVIESGITKDISATASTSSTNLPPPISHKRTNASLNPTDEMMTTSSLASNKSAKLSQER